MGGIGAGVLAGSLMLLVLMANSVGHQHVRLPAQAAGEGRLGDMADQELQQRFGFGRGEALDPGRIDLVQDLEEALPRQLGKNLPRRPSQEVAPPDQAAGA